MSKINTIDHVHTKIVILTNGCWLWTKARQKDGYGITRFNKKLYLAHRLFYEFYKGKIDRDLEIDHLCRNRACVNPSHLEAVSHQVNIDRGNFSANGPRISAFHRSKTHCAKGHPYSGPNLKIQKRGNNWRQCLACSKYSKIKVKINKKIDDSRWGILQSGAW